MRRRIVSLAVGAAILALSLFGLPSAVAVVQYFVQDESAELERAADSTALSIVDELSDPAHPPSLPDSAEGVVGLYSPTGTLITGAGPAAADSVVLRAREGSVTTGDVADDLVVAVPLVHGTTLTGIVRAATPHTEAYQRAALVWLGMAALAAAAVAATWLVARRFAARLARPLEDLSATAARIGDGDFTARAPHSGIDEIDRVAGTLDHAAVRIGETLDREREFSADASHQLRTPLTGLRLQLEAALDPPGQDLAAAIGSAISTTDRMETTIDDLLSLSTRAREPRSAIDLDPLLEDLHHTWDGPLATRGRTLRITRGSPLRPHVAESAVRQILGALMDNAVAHGRGTVTVTTRDSGDAIAVDVADEGTELDADADVFTRGHGSGHGIGLALARSLSEAEGGHLRLATTTPVTFTLLLPVGGG